MRLLTLLGGGLLLLLSRPQPPAVSAVPSPAPAENGSRLPSAVVDMANQLLADSEADLHHPHRRHDDLRPLDLAWQLLYELAVPYVDPPAGQDAQDYGLKFACRLVVLCQTIRRHYGLAPETGSRGWQLLRDLQSGQLESVQERWLLIAHDLQRVEAGDRCHYLFFLFWPQRYNQFMRGRH